MCDTASSFLAFTSIIKQLRGENGCPWDKKQTIASLQPYLESEITELQTAITNEDTVNLCEELGDVIYVIAMISEIANEQEKFSFNDVLDTVNRKLIRRHPHVFENLTQLSETELQQQWARIKAEEKSGKAV